MQNIDVDEKVAIIDKQLIPECSRGFDFYVCKLSCPINEVLEIALLLFHFNGFAPYTRGCEFE